VDTFASAAPVKSLSMFMKGKPAEKTRQVDANEKHEWEFVMEYEIDFRKT